MTYHANHNIGIAMDTPKGLVVPVIKQVQLKSIMEIARELLDLQDAAMAGTLTEAQMSGGTFSLSNIGSIGGTYAVPVIVVPQVAIGAFGRQIVVPRYVDKDGNTASTDAIYNGTANIKPCTLMNVSWSADHRVIDGATVARFSNTWKRYLENPSLMLAHSK
jgi:2-oxoisovalerate dehydrogenase E2 component (dihydrolipoyl transacylase)